MEKTKALFSSSKKVSKIIKGGKTRKESSFNGVFSISDEEANVLIHDGVRPCIENEIIQNCITSLSYYNALCTCIPSSDTVFETEENIITKTLKREHLYLAQTPQAFKLSLIKKAHALAINDNDFTDDCGLIKKYNLSKIHIIKGSTKNIKITYPFDYSIAKLILESKN
ncbi:2-C-methyl-D-erythritol 4-phosphate cytidylyltransferase [bacterium]|nr:2-C-methyl-D-erythritol 4-phosphate cytidylyltransferase [bacterium]